MLPTVATLLGINRTYIDLYLEFNTLTNNLLKVCQNGELRVAEGWNGDLTGPRVRPI